MAHIEFFQFRRPKGQVVGDDRDKVKGQINLFQLVGDVGIAGEHLSRYERDSIMAKVQLQTITIKFLSFP